MNSITCFMPKIDSRDTEKFEGCNCMEHYFDLERCQWVNKADAQWQ